MRLIHRHDDERRHLAADEVLANEDGDIIIIFSLELARAEVLVLAMVARVHIGHYVEVHELVELLGFDQLAEHVLIDEVRSPEEEREQSRDEVLQEIPYQFFVPGERVTEEEQQWDSNEQR